jgi:hypothetical protein
MLEEVDDGINPTPHKDSCLGRIGDDENHDNNY